MLAFGVRQCRHSHHKRLRGLRICWPNLNRVRTREILACQTEQSRHVSTTKRARSKTGKVSTIKLSDLTQGLLASEPLPPLEEPQQEQHGGYPTVIQQAINNMHKFKKCVVLTRVGSFYELYAEQATTVGALLNLKIASKKTSIGRVPMAGFPFFQLEHYLKILVQEHGRHVAISEEVAFNPADKVKAGGNMFDRQVKRVVTPGTLIDEHFLTPNEHNYLLAISFSSVNPLEQDQLPEDPVGLAWLDLSSGDFFTQITDLGSLESAVARVGPREIILNANLDFSHGHLKKLSIEQGDKISYLKTPSSELSRDELLPMLENAAAGVELDSFSPEERQSSGLLLKYVQEQLPGLPLRLQAPIRQKAENYMLLDKNSLRGLEVTQTLKDGLYKGSLLQAVRRTSTESGARLLSDRLTAPSMSLPIINDRLDLVETFLSNEVLREELTDLLKKTSDTLRLLQKFSFGRGDAEDLLGLSRTVALTQETGKLLLSSGSGQRDCLQKLTNRFNWNGPIELAERILSAIDEEGLMLRQRSEDLAEAHVADLARSVLENEADSEDMAKITKRLQSKKLNLQHDDSSDTPQDGEIWIMRRDASPTLKRLHGVLQQLLVEKVDLESSLQLEHDAKTLALKWTPGLGHIIHVKGRDTKSDLPASLRPVSSSKSTRSFYHQPWTQLGSRIEDAKSRIRAAEGALFTHLRDAVISNLVVLRRNAGVLDDVDVACSFARLADEHSLVRPVLNSGTGHRVYDGRHLMVETGLSATRGNTFTPNDCILGGADGTPRIWLVTGPNMAGKSTFLRQSALLSILAQTGSFVPAAHAEIGLVDAIFSRVGSADNTSQEQSTFMVEMLETAQILRHATSRSFVVMDEVGRGTTPEDGTAVGYAVLKHLHDVNGCRALFATHFHDLAELTGALDGVERWCSGVVEEDDGAFRYDHRLRRGVNRESHALKVARLARMPEDVVRDAEECLLRIK
ncbi:hypothetical protein FH972_026616 [Carpinus fangiana]|uniref:DNA mismatch repair proteins mutS family domain-containing protein n=1 Tax=Carpinus fangiana TaxID=176857 RepID=A0A5N6L4T8_9ROSI|nr:hypothetical protein FH972_026616 [Carpinus fangiana]